MAKQDKEQSKRFKDKAREIDADESGGLFERALKKIISPKERGALHKRPSPTGHETKDKNA